MIVLLLALFVSCEGFCHYRNWSHLLTCYGPQTHKFPIFSENIKHDTQHIDILNTSVTELPRFKEWSQLETMDIRDNSLLPCTEVFKLQHYYYVTTDCYRLERHNRKTYNYNELYSLLIIPFIILFPGLAAMWYKKYRVLSPPMDISDSNHKVDKGASV